MSKNLNNLTFSQFLTVRAVEEVSKDFEKSEDLKKSIDFVMSAKTPKIVEEYLSINAEPQAKKIDFELFSMMLSENKNLDKEKLTTITREIKISSKDWDKVNFYVAKVQNDSSLSARHDINDKTHISVPTSDYGKELSMLRKALEKDDPDNKYQRNKKNLILKAIDEYQKNDVVISPSGFLARQLGNYANDKRANGKIRAENGKEGFKYSELYGYTLSINAKVPRNIDLSRNYEKERKIKTELAPDAISKLMSRIKLNEK